MVWVSTAASGSLKCPRYYGSPQHTKIVFAATHSMFYGDSSFIRMRSVVDAMEATVRGAY